MGEALSEAPVQTTDPPAGTKPPGHEGAATVLANGWRWGRERLKTRRSWFQLSVDRERVENECLPRFLFLLGILKARLIRGNRYRWNSVKTQVCQSSLLKKTWTWLFIIYTHWYIHYIYTYRHTYTDIHIQTYIYRHTYRHTYMHTHTNIWTSIPKITTCPHLCRKQKTRAACLEANRCKAELEAVQSSSSQAEFGWRTCAAYWGS